MSWFIRNLGKLTVCVSYALMIYGTVLLVQETNIKDLDSSDWLLIGITLAITGQIMTTLFPKENHGQSSNKESTLS